MIYCKFIFLFLAVVGLQSFAFAKDIPEIWHGGWSADVEALADIRFVIEPSSKVSFALNGEVVPVTSFQMSPDQRTAIVHWEQGEGTLVRSDDGSIVAGIFDRRIRLRTVVLRRTP